MVSRKRARCPYHLPFTIYHFRFWCRSVHGRLEVLAGAESDDATLRDFDGGAGLGVARGPRLALRGLEGAEPDERDRLPFLERLRDALEEGFNGRRGAGLRDARILRDLGDEFLFVHESSGAWLARVESRTS